MLFKKQQNKPKTHNKETFRISFCLPDRKRFLNRVLLFVVVSVLVAILIKLESWLAILVVFIYFIYFILDKNKISNVKTGPYRKNKNEDLINNNLRKGANFGYSSHSVKITDDGIVLNNDGKEEFVFWKQLDHFYEKYNKGDNSKEIIVVKKNGDHIPLLKNVRQGDCRTLISSLSKYLKFRRG